MTQDEELEEEDEVIDDQYWEENDNEGMLL